MTSSSQPKQRQLPRGMRRLPSGRIQVRYRDPFARERSFTVDTISEARRRQAETRADLQRGHWFDPEGRRQTFGEFQKQWRAAWTVRGTTSSAADSRLRTHVLPRWRKAPLGAIDRLDVQTWINELGRSDLKASTIHSIYSLFHTIMEAAVDSQRIQSNPCRKIKLPPVDENIGQAISPEQAATLMAGFEDQMGATLALLTLGTGFRWGEGAGTRRGNLDLDGMLAYVVEPLHEARGKLWFEAPKSRTSIRDVPLCDAVATTVTTWLERVGPEADALLFLNRRGHPLRRSDFRKNVWDPARVKIDAKLRWHDLRDTYASWLEDGGIPRTVISELLGHKQGEHVTGRYLYAVPGVQDKVLSALTERIGPAVEAYRKRWE